MAYEYDYPRPAVSVDAIVFRQLGRHTNILLIQRKNAPFAGAWALPGGFLEMDETVEQAVVRELREETGLQAESVEQLHTFSTVDRDPRGRVITIALVVEVDEKQTPVADDDAAKAEWFEIGELPPLAFDHSTIIDMAINRQREPFIR